MAFTIPKIPKLPSLGQMSTNPMAPATAPQTPNVPSLQPKPNPYASMITAAPKTAPVASPAVPPLSSMMTGGTSAPSVTTPNMASNNQTSTPATNITPDQYATAMFVALNTPTPNTGGSPAAPASTTPAQSQPKPAAPTLITTPSGAVVNAQTGQIVVPPPASGSQENPVPSPTPAQAPAMQMPATPNISGLERDVQNNMQLSPEEIAAQEDIDRTTEAMKRGIFNTGQQPIAMDFITGQQRAIEQRGLGILETLEQKAARLQAKRIASLDASKFALERADKAKTTAGSDTQVIDGQIVERQADGTYKSVFGAPKTTKRETSLTEINGRRVLVDTQTGQTIADLGRAGTEGVEDTNKLLSVSEAEALGVPYGTTRGQAFGTMPTAASTEGKTEKLQQTLEVINNLANHPGKSAAVGASFQKFFGAIPGVPDMLPGSARADFNSQLDRAKSLLTLENLKLLKGAMSDKDVALLESAASALRGNISEAEFNKEIKRIQTALTGALSGGGSTQAAPAAGSTYQSSTTGNTYVLPN